MKNKKVTIYCCYHAPKLINEYKLYELENENFVLYNTSNDVLNKFLNEASVFKYIYENDKDSDIIGICHYRRQLYLDDIDINDITNDRTVSYTSVDNFNNSIKYWAYNILYWPELYDIFVNYTIQKYGQHNKYLKEETYYHSGFKTTFVSRQAGFMTRSRFFEFYDFYNGYFNYVFEYYGYERTYYGYIKLIKEKFINNVIGKPCEWFAGYPWAVSENEYKTDYCFRALGFIGEMLFSIFMTANHETIRPIVYECTDLRYTTQNEQDS